MKISTQLKNSQEFLNNPDVYKFIIPGYQRRYEWDEDNISSLLGDIKEYIDSNQNTLTFQNITANPAPPNVLNLGPYLIGSVFIHKDIHNGAPRHKIIDGQQRATTISIIAAVFSAKLESLVQSAMLAGEYNLRQRDAINNRFIAPCKALYVHPSDEFNPAITYKIVPQNKFADDYKNTIGDPSNEQIPANPITPNYYKCRAEALKFIEIILQPHELLPNKIETLCIYCNTLAKNVSVIEVTVTSENNNNDIEALNLFSKINARGKDLSSSDLLKVSFFQNENATDGNLMNEWDNAFGAKNASEIDNLFNSVIAAININFPANHAESWRTFFNGRGMAPAVAPQSLLTNVIFPLGMVFKTDFSEPRLIKNQ